MGRARSREARRLAHTVGSAALAALLVAPPAWGGDEQPDAAELFRAWFERRYHFDALEAYAATRPDGLSVEFLLARRWVDGRAQVAMKVERPPDLRHRAYLLNVRADAPDRLAFLENPGAPRPTWRVGQLPVQQWDADLFGTPVNLTPLEIRPLLPDELEHVRLPDERIAGEPCRLIASHPVRDVGIDRIELALSVRSGVALRTRYFRDEREVRRVLVDPADVRAFGERSAPALRRIESGAGTPLLELRLANAQFDPELPDRLFSLGNLKLQRYPSL